MPCKGVTGAGEQGSLRRGLPRARDVSPLKKGRKGNSGQAREQRGQWPGGTNNPGDRGGGSMGEVGAAGRQERRRGQGDKCLADSASCAPWATGSFGGMR